MRQGCVQFGLYASQVGFSEGDAAARSESAEVAEDYWAPLHLLRLPVSALQSPV